MSDQTETDKCDRLDKAFEEEREKIGMMAQQLVADCKDLTKIPEVQALMLSYRQIYCDKMAKYRSSVNRRKELDMYHKSIRLRTHHEDTTRQIRYTDRQIDQIVAAEMAPRFRLVAITEVQIDFLKDMVDLMDKLGYAVKNRIEHEKLVLPL